MPVMRSVGSLPLIETIRSRYIIYPSEVACVFDLSDTMMVYDDGCIPKNAVDRLDVNELRSSQTES